MFAIVVTTLFDRKARSGSRRLRRLGVFLRTAHGPLLAVFLLLLTAHGTLHAQSPEPVDVLRIDTDLVTLNVSVFNRTASQASVSLQQKDFAVLDDGAPQEIAFFESRDSP